MLIPAFPEKVFSLLFRFPLKIKFYDSKKKFKCRAGYGTVSPMNDISPESILEWYVSAGVDETIGDSPVNRFDVPAEPDFPVPAAVPQRTFAPIRPAVGVADTAPLADRAQSLAELREIIEKFDGCPLKKSARSTVFGAGNPQARLMIVGEAPGAEEDRQGLPFVGASGHLLDKMLQSIGLKREDVYITNILPWRPPANRKPSQEESALMTPFVRRHIALVQPKVLLLLGGSAVSALMNIGDGIIKTRGRWLKYEHGGTVADAMPSFHPAYLLRQPAQKKEAWRDLIEVRRKLASV